MSSAKIRILIETTKNSRKSASFQQITQYDSRASPQQGGPIPRNHLARALMPRQPYSEAVKSDVSVPYKGNRRGRKDY